MESTESAETRRPGRKANPNLTTVSVTFHRDELKALDEVVMQEGRSRSDLIREACRKTWLKRRA